MKRASGAQAPLLVLWSPSRVRIVDPTTRASFVGGSIAECATALQKGREVVVGVAQRNAFIRALPMPPVSKEEVTKLLPFKLATQLPVAANEVVSGYRLAIPAHGGERLAIVGAIKTESLRRIWQDVEAAGLRVRAVLPVAFGSWLAARSRRLADCAVVQVESGNLSIDIVSGGELRYSRSVPCPDSQEEIDDEIERSFSIVQIAPSPILSAASPDLRSEFADHSEPLDYLADAHSLEKLLFSFELPERTQAARARSQSWIRGRAVAAMMIALAFGAYSVHSRQLKEAAVAQASKQKGADLRDALKRQALAEGNAKHLMGAKQVLERAFHPAQSFADVVAGLSEDTPPKTWLTGLTLERGKLLVIRGDAADGLTVSKFVAQLGQDPRFRGMKLVSANKGLIGKRPVIEFGITGRVVGNLPVEETVTEERKS